MQIENTAAEGKVQLSIREIVGDSGTNYGKGVYLDSDLLENLTDAERKEMVKLRIEEMGGNYFPAQDYSGNIVQIKIADNAERFVNSNGVRVRATKDLATKHNNRIIKQEAAVHSDELIESASFERKETAHHPHGWLDNNGKNPWDRLKVIIQDKTKSVWEATLRVPNTANGEKYLYDIDPITMVERAGMSATISTAVTVPQTPADSQEKSSKDQMAIRGNGYDDSFEDYILNLIESDNNEIVYDKDRDEVSMHATLGESLSLRANDTSSATSIRTPTAESQSKSSKDQNDGKLKHPRTDNFVDFSHGEVLILSGSNKYKAETVVGITNNGEYVFYDIVDMTPANFNIKKSLPPPPLRKIPLAI